MNNLNLKNFCSVINENIRVLVFKNRQLIFDDYCKNLTARILKQHIKNIEIDYRNDCLLISLVDDFVYDKRFNEEAIDIIVNNSYIDLDNKEYFKNCLQHRLEIDFTFARGVDIIISQAKISHENNLSDDVDKFLHQVATSTPGTRIILSQNFDNVYGYTIDSEGAINY